MSTIKFDSWKNTDGTENYKCRAWVNFDGTTNTGGNCDIRESGNVSSVTDNGTGDYTVNFETAMPDDDYAVTAGAGDGDTSKSYLMCNFGQAPQTTKFRVAMVNSSSTQADRSYAMVAVFR